jgi:ribosome biogenesis GTPase / thiamine phosphate phosphatase
MTETRSTSKSRGASPVRQGRIVADFGRHVLVEDAEHRIHPCTVRTRGLRVVCGDRVHWRPGAAGGRGVIDALLPRTRALARPDSRGRPEVLAANLDQLIVVCAVSPPPDALLIDRFLLAAACLDIGAIIVCNKIELAVDRHLGDDDALLADYAAIPYAVVRTSATHGEGLEHLAALAAGHTSILVGQSGVGKSSLLNALCPDSTAATGAVSVRSGEGTHTTSASRLYALPGGGDIIDSPGVREYTPYLDRAQDPAQGYREFFAPARRCRFRNCRHLEEPECGVKAAVAETVISQRRYASYRLLALQHD